MASPFLLEGAARQHRTPTECGGRSATPRTPPPCIGPARRNILAGFCQGTLSLLPTPRGVNGDSPSRRTRWNRPFVYPLLDALASVRTPPPRGLPARDPVTRLRRREPARSHQLPRPSGTSYAMLGAKAT